MDLSDPPSSDGGNDPFEESDEDVRVMEEGRKRKRPTRLLQQRMEFDESIMDEDDQMVKGMCFKDVKEFRKALESSHIKQGRSYNFLKNKMEKVKVRCADSNCPFSLFASKIAGEPTFMIRQDVVEHTCGITREASRLNSTWLAKNYENHFRVDPNWKVSAFIEAVKRDFNYEITKRMAYRTRAHAHRLVLGHHDDQYRRIRDYLQTLLDKNPGSIAVVRTEPRLADHHNPRFYGMFISFSAQIEGFLAGCRPFFGLDGCFVKLANGAQVLAATARDGSNNMYPLAFGVVNKEDTENWTWFLQTLESAIGQGDRQGGWTIMSDRQKVITNILAFIFYKYV
jgi:hypothetical protein